MKNLFKLTSLMLLVFVAQFSFAQNRVITGKVTDSKDGSGMSGATIVAKGTRTGVQSKADGTFSISISSTVSTLVISTVGYATMEVSVTGMSTVEVSLVGTNTSLNEVVVIGYGTQRRREVTGAISKVSSDKLNSIPVPSFEAALQGKAPGVQIIQGNGLAGSGAVVRIRGIGSISASGDPLYVVDGIPIVSDQFLRGNGGAMNQNPLSSLNPADIESVEILKDAGATGIYGSRGANGVIIITTKRGKSGKPQFNFNTRVGIATYAKRQKFANTTEWLQLRQEAWANDGRVGLANLPGGYTFATASQNNTDWWDLLTQTGIINENNLSMTQGNAKLKTFANLTYSNNEGYIKSNSYQRISGRLNMDYNVTKNLKISLTSGINKGSNRRVPAAWDGGIGDAMSSALPFFTVYNPNGTYFQNGANPVRRIQETKRREIDNRFIGGLSFEYQPIKNLFIRANGSLEYVTAFDDIYESNQWINQSNPDSGYAKRFPYWGTNKNANLTVNYLTTVKENHKFNFLLGTEAQEYIRKGYLFEIGNFEPVPYWENASRYRTRRDKLIKDRQTGTPPQLTEKALEEYTFNSFFGRVNYSYKDRYALQLTARVDGSSKFGPNNKHGFFPAISGAWTMSEEDFIKDIKFINFLKLRASYGIVGNANIPAGKYYGNYQPGGITYSGNPTLYLNYDGYGNPDLKWETMHNIDAAVEFALFSSKLTGEVAYYNKQTTDILMEPGTAPSNGVGKVYRNLPNSKILNEGIELSLNYKIINKAALKWSVGGNISKNYNEVLDWELGPDAVSGGTNDTRVVKGLPLGVNYLVRYYGVDPADGLPIWLDVNGKQTKTFSLDHRVFAGSIMPDYMGGFNSSFEYKNFELSTLFNFVIGGKIYDNSGKYQFMGVSKKNWNFRETFFDRWTKPGDVTRYPRLAYDITTFPGVPGEDQFNSTLFLHDASFLRLRELTVGYRLSAQTLKKLKIKTLRFYLTGSNLLTFTKYPGGDPEITRDFENPQDRNLSPNVTYLTAPTQRTVIFGINLGF
ncbi:MAG: TonB-dependent receptor [Chitinophagaceae bacterium]|nr:TonB-dependent receptor [Chitinophagaceae bacterium]MBL0272709.1 TonB-dependent receptor [Chitinophagaceae bacterium]